MKIRIRLYLLPCILIISSTFYHFSDSFLNSTDDARSVETSLKTVLNFIRLTKGTDAFEFLETPNELKEKKDEKLECSLLPSNCADIQQMGATSSGNYLIYSRGKKSAKSMQVYCDLQTDGGGWLVFQRRGNFSITYEDFFRTWQEYKEGFGDIGKEFWIGNDYLYLLTNQDRMTLRIDLEGYDDKTTFAEYTNFLVQDEVSLYRMSFDDYSGNAGDALEDQKGHPFSTKDNDNKHNCADKWKGGWWYSECYFSNLNGLYLEEDEICINWFQAIEGDRCMKKTEMKLRPQYFTLDKD